MHLFLLESSLLQLAYHSEVNLSTRCQWRYTASRGMFVEARGRHVFLYLKCLLSDKFMYVGAGLRNGFTQLARTDLRWVKVLHEVWIIKLLLWWLEERLKFGWCLSYYRGLFLRDDIYSHLLIQVMAWLFDNTSWSPCPSKEGNGWQRPVSAFADRACLHFT